MNIQIALKNLPFLECLSSETRIRMIELLNQQPMNIGELAAALGISSAIVTKHIQKMEEAGIVGTESVTGKRGVQKVCSLKLDKVMLLFKEEAQRADHTHSVSVPVGQYSSFQVKPTCGLASAEKLIGMLDDPRYFADTEHVKAAHLWFASGYVEYRIPNYLLRTQKPRSISITLEICSEAPGYNEDWPSDITFSLNGISLGTWTCPGDYGKERGVYTPDWWNNGTQHGLFKTITVNADGSWIDGVRMSDVSLRQTGIEYGQEMLFRIACHENAQHCGGVSLFGKHFGNYNQDIEIKLHYES